MTCDYFFGSKFLIGNDDRNSEKKHVVYGVLAKQLRFRPRTHQAGVCMRTEVFGVKKTQVSLKLQCIFCMSAIIVVPVLLSHCRVVKDTLLIFTQVFSKHVK